MRSDKVISCVKDDMGNFIGVSNSIPILDTRVYDVMFPYGSLENYVEKPSLRTYTRRLTVKGTIVS